MSINRIGPSQPSQEKRDRDIPDDKRFKKQMTVEKVGEIDADQKKKKKERAAPDEDVKTESDTEKNYSPYEPQFNFSSTKQVDLFGRNTTNTDQPSVFGSPQPSMVPSPPSIDDDASSQLPSSQDFYSAWQPMENPPELEQQFPLQQMQQNYPQQQQQGNVPTKQEGRTIAAPMKGSEQGKKAGHEQKGKQSAPAAPFKKGKEEASPHSQKKDESAPKDSFPFLVNDKSSSEKGKKSAKGSDDQTPEETFAPYQPWTQGTASSHEPAKKTEKETRSSPSGMQSPTDERQKSVSPQTSREQASSFNQRQDDRFQERPAPQRQRPSYQEPQSNLQGASSFYSPIMSSSKGEDKKDDKKEKGAKPDASALAAASAAKPMPPEAAAAAGLAASQTLPYANPEVQNLFAQMVGTIIVMTTPPGISRTQVILNSPAFAGSVFQGAEITLERYSTAPDSFNIRLTGSPQAVNIFNENIQGLYTAFQKGKFNFRVNRLEASHEETKPLFRRKGGAGGAGSDMSDDSSGKR